MKHKVQELEGALLDAAVAKAQDWLYEFDARNCFATSRKVDGLMTLYRPSVQWAHGGPIIEREKVGLAPLVVPPDEWLADCGRRPAVFGPTPLVAAMRAYVASEFGDEVEL